MYKKILAEKRRKAFKVLEKEFINEMVPVSYQAGEDGHEGTLDIFLDDIVADGVQSYGEFFFLPIDSETEGIQVYVNLITVLEEVDEKNVSELITAIAILNAFLPLGAFAYNPSEKTLIFRYSHVMSADLSDDELKTEMDRSMNVSIQTIENFAYMLVEVNDGERDTQSIVALFDVTP